MTRSAWRGLRQLSAGNRFLLVSPDSMDRAVCIDHHADEGRNQYGAAISDVAVLPAAKLIASYDKLAWPLPWFATHNRGAGLGRIGSGVVGDPPSDTEERLMCPHQGAEQQVLLQRDRGLIWLLQSKPQE